MPSSSIAAANKRVAKVIDSTVAGTKKIRGSYEKYTPGLLVIMLSFMVHMSATIKHFKSKHPRLKWSTVNDWEKAILLKTKRSYCTAQLEPVESLESKTCGFILR